VSPERRSIEHAEKTIYGHCKPFFLIASFAILQTLVDPLIFFEDLSGPLSTIFESLAWRSPT
jgi:hypothetical protein